MNDLKHLFEELLNVEVNASYDDDGMMIKTISANSLKEVLEYIQIFG